MKILIVEDEMDLRNSLKKGLEKRGYSVDVASDGEEGLEKAFVNSYDLMILDLNLPRVDGLTVLDEIRKEDKMLKVLILSARTEVSERIRGLDGGANDYLVKPFHFDELEARVRSLLRRSFVQNDVIMRCGTLEVNTSSREVYQDSERIELTRTEFAILEYLLVNVGRKVSSEELMEHVYDSNTDLFSNSLAVHIHSLRKKIKHDVIKNVRGFGYFISGEE